MYKNVDIYIIAYGQTLQKEGYMNHPPHIGTRQIEN